MRTQFNAREHALMQAALRDNPVKPGETLRELQERLAAAYDTPTRLGYVRFRKHSVPHPQVVAHVLSAVGQTLTRAEPQKQ